MKNRGMLILVLACSGCHSLQRAVPKASPDALNQTAKALVVPTEQKKLPISEIALERIPGMSMKPQPYYTLTLRSNGTATYIGNGVPTRKGGTYQMSIPLAEYARLAHLVEESRFFKMRRFYGGMATDIPEILVSVMREGKRKIVMDMGRVFQPKYEVAAPQTLKNIETQIDAVVANVPWTKSSDKMGSNQDLNEAFTKECEQELKKEMSVKRVQNRL